MSYAVGPGLLNAYGYAGCSSRRPWVGAAPLRASERKYLRRLTKENAKLNFVDIADPAMGSFQSTPTLGGISSTGVFLALSNGIAYGDGDQGERTTNFVKPTRLRFWYDVSAPSAPTSSYNIVRVILFQYFPISDPASISFAASDILQLTDAAGSAVSGIERVEASYNVDHVGRTFRILYDKTHSLVYSGGSNAYQVMEVNVTDFRDLPSYVRNPSANLHSHRISYIENDAAFTNQTARGHIYMLALSQETGSALFRLRHATRLFYMDASGDEQQLSGF
jgi:hypothetical protein